MHTKRCNMCEQELSIDNFSRNKSKKDGHNGHCRRCHKQYRDQHYRNNKQKIVGQIVARRTELNNFVRQYKQDAGCKNCGQTHVAILDFHHRNGEDKEICIANGVRHGWSKKRLMSEIKKCDVLCANCHRILHWNESQGTVSQE